MANRRCLQPLIRYLQSIKRISPISQSLAHSSANVLQNTPTPNSIHHIFEKKCNIYQHSSLQTRHCCSKPSDSEYDDNDDEEDDDDDEDEIEDDGEYYEVESDDENAAPLSPEEKVKAAAEIGYSVIGPLQPTDRVFKRYEPVFAVVQIGSHQFKVSNRDSIYVEKLKYCEVNDKVVLNKVLMLGSVNQTIIGRPILPDAAVHAVIEEHALDAKVIIFKKKRRKNYRRKNGHRQELTKLRITDIRGIEKPEMITPIKRQKKEKLEKTTPLMMEKKGKPGKVAVEA